MDKQHKPTTREPPGVSHPGKVCSEALPYL